MNAPNSASTCGTSQPPCENPPESSSPGPPGACMTPSRVRNVVMVSFDIRSLLDQTSNDRRRDRQLFHGDAEMRAHREIFGRNRIADELLHALARPPAGARLGREHARGGCEVSAHEQAGALRCDVD